ncbi:response regulator [Thermocoleostomius sinensis]|uniref:Response regulator n=1 Tax=Thermocoleostomius sinensis A174 TaxID=2016057 RepID=A0A9E8ZDU7_9CYAN|nr:response regulator [Thermocoleostomius sinensis]WAL60012.1 response regulator [Thermocoleostomius sinensis A174]
MASHKILVIDDSRVIRNMVRDMLPKGNFEVLEAKDGLEGMNCIRQERPNLIMLDFLLPRMSGWEVFQQIQNQTDLQAIPLVLMSGRREEVTEKISEPFEYFEFIEKPFEQKQLFEAIKSAMVKAKLPRPQATPAATIAPIERTESSAEVQRLIQKMEKMQAEIDLLKKQMSQLLTFIKQKLK